MVMSVRRYSIDESFRKAVGAHGGALPRRPEFSDPLLASIQSFPLSRVIDEELDRFYNPSGPVEMITRVFRRFTRRPD